MWKNKKKFFDNYHIIFSTIFKKLWHISGCTIGSTHVEQQLKEIKDPSAASSTSKPAKYNYSYLQVRLPRPLAPLPAKYNYYLQVRPPRPVAPLPAKYNYYLQVCPPRPVAPLPAKYNYCLQVCLPRPLALLPAKYNYFVVPGSPVAMKYIETTMRIILFTFLSSAFTQQ